MFSRTTNMFAYSAPGKAMMAGGYLVLDPAYRAYVTALSSRMHVVVQKRAPAENSTLVVELPQFNGHWAYHVHHHEGYSVAEPVNPQGSEASETFSRNPFLEATVKAVLNYVGTSAHFNYHLTLFSDPGYHTQHGATPQKSTKSNTTFLFHGRPIEQVPKTGMGLSAGLVTVVATALLCSLLGRPASEILNVIHNVAQLAHCEAQGKIGLGFDVAAAVYGSIVYRRFPPETIAGLLGQPLSAELAAQVRTVADSEWDMVHSPCSLPKSVRLLMGDVSGGSETPKLVSQVLAWRKADPQSKEVYASLDAANEQFMAEIEKETQRDHEAGTENRGSQLAAAVANIRTCLQTLTARSGAAVEPAEQTRLLDVCAGLPGCLGGVVPGAGGYDAICLLVKAAQLDRFYTAAKAEAALDHVTWLDLQEQALGVQEMDPADYAGLVR